MQRHNTTISFSVIWEDNQWEIKNYRSNCPRDIKAGIMTAGDEKSFSIKLENITTDECNVLYRVGENSTLNTMPNYIKLAPKAYLNSIDYFDNHFVIKNVGACASVRAGTSSLIAFETYTIPLKAIKIDITIVL